eukprot:6483894-Amphidinium_carterae.1
MQGFQIACVEAKKPGIYPLPATHKYITQEFIKGYALHFAINFVSCNTLAARYYLFALPIWGHPKATVTFVHGGRCPDSMPVATLVPASTRTSEKRT